jgi:hypothetical protein
VSKDERMGGYFSKPKVVRGQKHLRNTDVLYWVCSNISQYIWSSSSWSINILHFAKTTKPPIIKNFAYGNEKLVLIMDLEWVVMRTSADCNILRKVLLVRRLV